MFVDILLLIVGMALLIKGADFFVDGASRVAKAMKIPSLIIGLTLVSVGTSAPELSVSLTSAIKGLADMSVGNVVGSNIFNILMVVGLSALFTTMTVSKDVKKYDVPILIGLFVVLMLFSFVLSPNTLTRLESIILFVSTIVYIFFLILRSKNEPFEEEVDEKPRKWYINVLFIIVGLAGIIFGGDFVVDSASSIAIRLSMSEMLVSLTIVAVGTSLPELVTSMVAAKKGENDIAIGNAIGSCIFNVVLILGLSSTIRPLAITNDTLIDMIVMTFSVVLLAIFTIKKPEIDKKKGIIFILIYVVYLTYIRN